MALIESFGWSWEYIDDEMTLPRLKAITARWSEVPPLSTTVLIIARILGYEHKPAVTSSKRSDQDVSELMGMLGGLGFSSEKPAWLTKST